MTGSAPQEAEGSDESTDNAPEPVSGEPVDLERIARLWPAVLDQLRQSSAPALASMFEGARPVGVDREESTLTVGFPASDTFNKRKAEAPEKREQVAKALIAVTGERLRPVYVVLDGDAAPATAPEEEQVDEDELLERLKSEFDAEEVS
jgi:hypothetical protein